MLPLKGMTMLGKIVAHLMKSEVDHGIICVMLSRVCKFSDIGLKDSLDMHRLCKVIRKQLKMRRHTNKETRLVRLAQATLDKHLY